MSYFIYKVYNKLAASALAPGLYSLVPAVCVRGARVCYPLRVSRALRDGVRASRERGRKAKWRGNETEETAKRYGIQARD